MMHDMLAEKPAKERSQIFEFLIVFNLPKWVDKYIVHLKDDFAQIFGSFPSRQSTPHITVAKFSYQVQNQDAILLMLQDSLYVTRFLIQSFACSNRIK